MSQSPLATSPLSNQQLLNLTQSPPHSGHFNMTSFGGSNSSLQRIGSNTSLTRVRQYSMGEQDAPSTLFALDSSPKMEGVISDVAPELSEDILMDVSQVYTNQC